jgi:DNA-binding XRE family transcriptional regulator
MTPSTRAQIDKFIDEIADNPAEVKAALDRIEAERRVVDSLLGARISAGMSQRDLAAASGLSAAKICRMETGNDGDLNFGDVQAYLKGLGTTLRVSFRPPRRRPRPTPAMA